MPRVSRSRRRIVDRPSGRAIRSVRRWGIWTVAIACAALVSMTWPAHGDEIAGSSSFTVAFFATILTGEAVIFAISFSATSSWPSLREIDAHIAFREWVVIGWIGVMLLGIGLLTSQNTLATAGSVLFVIADVYGIFSFVRLFGLASVKGRRRLLRQTLQRRLDGTGLSLTEASDHFASDETITGFLREFDGAVAQENNNSLRDRVTELTTTRCRPGGAEARAGLHFELLHRLCRTSLVNGLDGVVVSRCADDLISSMLDQIDAVRDASYGQAMPAERAAAIAGQLSRYLAWLGSTAVTLSNRQVAQPGAARELVALSVRARESILLRLDPDPIGAGSISDLGSVLTSPLAVVTWLRQFVEFHGSSQAAAFYPAFEIITGAKFEGNYWDGASVLAEMREALYGPADRRVDNTATHRSRAAFGAVAEFDRLWIHMSVGALATLRDARAPHPAELRRPEFSDDRRLLGAYVRSFATHRPFHTATSAQVALLDIFGRSGSPSSLWQRSNTLIRDCHYPVPPPLVSITERLAAGVLAIALRLAPLDAAGSERELLDFLAGLPTTALHAAHRLTTRILPPPARPTDGPADLPRMIADHLSVLRHPGFVIPAARVS